MRTVSFARAARTGSPCVASPRHDAQTVAAALIVRACTLATGANVFVAGCPARGDVVVYGSASGRPQSSLTTRTSVPFRRSGASRTLQSKTGKGVTRYPFGCTRRPNLAPRHPLAAALVSRCNRFASKPEREPALPDAGPIEGPAPCAVDCSAVWRTGVTRRRTH
jgi:hypothetical protein